MTGTFLISRQLIAQGISYAEYREKIDQLIGEGKTTGTKQTQALVDFTKLNVQRMNRLDKRRPCFQSWQ
jgi:hypothetical protein